MTVYFLGVPIDFLTGVKGMFFFAEKGLHDFLGVPTDLSEGVMILFFVERGVFRPLRLVDRL